MAYTYLIGWSKLEKYYYGVRYSKFARPEELWVTYKTSSKYVKEIADEFGPPDLIQIRKIFNNKVDAINWESKVLRRMRVIENSKFINRWDNSMVPININGHYPFEDSVIQAKVERAFKEKYGGKGSGSDIIKKKVFDTNVQRYGTYHTLHLDNVKDARIQGNLQKFGTDNAFKNKEQLAKIMLERHGVTNMMLDPATKLKHANVMKEKDWTDRNIKVKETNLQKYGTACAMNRSEIRMKHSRVCPFLCRDSHKYDAGNFTNHMKKKHNWTTEQIQDFKNEN